jgi:hypothetical protein
VKYTYDAGAAAALAPDARAEAIAEIHGHSGVVARGRVRDGKLRLTFRRLHRGRYQVILLELLAHHAPLLIGDTSLVIS